MPDVTPTETTPYTEPHRPQFHFSPQQQWMNDPNGMVYYDGEYHLFYQYYPDSTVWGPMHWGHALSTDLVHWEHLPVALYPDTLGYIFSGSAVVDEHNTTGFQTGETPPLVAIFTQHLDEGARAGRIDFQTQGIAYSNDKGRTWTTYEGNPVIPNPGIKDFRDPKVFWHDESNQWVLVLAAADRVQFYGSPDLKSWSFLSDFGARDGNHGGVWECPDLFRLTVDETGEAWWVLLLSINPGAPNGGSGTQYFVGRFDGKTFTNTNPPETELWLDYGPDNYAGVTWSGVAPEDGRRLFIGWMSNWAYAQVVPTVRWRSAMTVPRTLSLVETPGGLRVASQPVVELERLRTAHTTLPPTTVVSRLDVDSLDGAVLLEAVVTFDVGADAGEAFGIELANTAGETYRIGYDRMNGHLYTDRTNAGPDDFSEAFAPSRHTAPYRPAGDHLTLHLLVDQSSAEVFVDAGRVVMTGTFFPGKPFDQARLFSDGGATAMTAADFYRLQSIWD